MQEGALMKTSNKVNYIYNDTFSTGEHFQLNACVGDNGNPDLYTYANGFLDASIQLCNFVIDGRPKPLVDLLIYPIAFNMRHGVELWLKLLILDLERIRSEVTLSYMKLSSIHDLRILWEHFKNNALNKDYRYQEHIRSLEVYINDIGEIDPTGQTFRYPYSNESKKHLTKTPLINIFVLRQRLFELEEKLINLWNLSCYLIDEYGTGTYTKSLSRQQIYQLAEFLPSRELWRNSDFSKIKKKAKIKFQLSSTELSKAIKIIEGHYEFSYKIGIYKQLNHATVQDLFYYFKAWSEYQKIAESVINDDTDAVKCQEVLIDEMKSNLSEESIADLYAVAECSFPFITESYNSRYDQELRTIKHKKNSYDEFRIHLLYLLKKTPYPYKIVVNLLELKQHKIVNLLCEKFQFLLEIRKGIEANSSSQEQVGAQ